MKILVIGGGGREHTLVWKLKQSPRVDKIFCAPGNGGIRELAECVTISIDDSAGLLKFVQDTAIDITVVGPEAPLVAGIVDMFRTNGLKIFGPTQKAAQIEGSKIFAKNLMKKYDIPTADYQTFYNYEDARNYINFCSLPVVVKADGLAAGKGVIICKSLKDAHNALNSIMIEKVFGASGNGIVIEEFLQGEELSILAITDGKDFLLLPSSQDHKAIYDGDVGPNTGGMGAYAPAPLADDTMIEQISTAIIQPAIDAMRSEGIPYTGVLYAGLMITRDGPKVLEFNCRFGDPETQSVLPLVENDILDLIEASINGTIYKHIIKTCSGYTVCIVVSSKGYPGLYEKGKEITGLDSIVSSKDEVVFHSGTVYKDGRILTAGGRVLCVCALRPKLDEAINSAYELVKSIHFEKAYYRTDIGKKGLQRLQQQLK
jgi:phosphoribosylamine--glycine ligase